MIYPICANIFHTFTRSRDFFQKIFWLLAQIDCIFELSVKNYVKSYTQNIFSWKLIFFSNILCFFPKGECFAPCEILKWPLTRICTSEFNNHYVKLNHFSCIFWITIRYLMKKRINYDLSNFCKYFSHFHT